MCLLGHQWVLLVVLVVKPHTLETNVLLTFLWADLRKLVCDCCKKLTQMKLFQKVAQKDFCIFKTSTFFPSCLSSVQLQLIV